MEIFTSCLKGIKWHKIVMGWAESVAPPGMEGRAHSREAKRLCRLSLGMVGALCSSAGASAAWGGVWSVAWELFLLSLGVAAMMLCATGELSRAWTAPRRRGRTRRCKTTQQLLVSGFEVLLGTSGQSAMGLRGFRNR